MGVNVAAVRDSFEALKPRLYDFAERFYESLFRDYPASRQLFAGIDMEQQQTALMSALMVAIENLDRPEMLTRYLMALGERHFGYGVKPQHYEWVGAVLLKTLGEFLGSSWNHQLQGEWAMLYGVLVEAMQTGVRQAQQTARDTMVDEVMDQNTTAEIRGSDVGEKILDFSLGLDHLQLPQSLKNQIERTVTVALERLVKAEVERCFQEQVERIAKMTEKDLLQLVG